MLKQRKRYAFFREDGSLARVRAQRAGDLEVQIISDDPLTSRQKDLMQTFVGLDSVVFQRQHSIEKKRLGKIVTIMRCIDV